MNIILFLLFFIILLYDVKKGIIIYAPFKLFFIRGYILYGNIGFDLIVSIVAFILYLCTYGINRKMKVPWLIGLLVGLIAYIANSLYPLFHPMIALIDTFCVYLYSIIYFASIQTKEDRQLAVRSIIIVFILLVGNGLIEFLTQNNILGDFQRSYIKEGVFISEKKEVRFGVFRTRSFVPHAIGFGVECTCFFIFFLLYAKTLKKLSLSYYSLIVLSAIGVFISGSRTPLLGLGIMLIPLLVNSSFFNIRHFVLLCGFLLVVYVFTESYVIDMLLSLEANNKSKEVSGSSFEMRMIQLNYSVYYWLQKPIWGWGASADVLHFGDRSEIFGGESVWFTLMMKRGLVGMISYIFIYISIFWSVRHLKIKKYIIGFMVGWLSIATGTNLPGVSFFFPLMIITLLYKYREEFKEEFGSANNLSYLSKTQVDLLETIINNRRR